MVDVKISELPVAGSAAGADQLEANQAGTSRSITVAQVATAVANSTDITGSYLPLAGGTLTGGLTGTTATMSGSITSTGGNIVASGGSFSVDRTGDAAAAFGFFNSDAGFQAGLFLRTGNTGTSSRWAILKSTTAEGGSNAGSNLQINAYDDAGALLSTALSITRSTGMVTLSGGLTGAMVGYATAVPFTSVGVATTPVFQVAAPTTVGMSVQMYHASFSSPPVINLSKSKTTTLGAQALVSATENLGSISFNGSDGVKFVEGASIRAIVDGTPGVDDMPTRLVFYTSSDGTATPTEAMRIASNNLVTLAGALAGTTATFSGTVSAPGAQTQMVFVETGAVATGTTIIPLDDTIPQQTEGDQYMSLAITPKSATSKLIIDVTIQLTASINVNVAWALFQDAAANALAANFVNVTSGGANNACRLQHIMTSGTTSSTTFKVRAGPSAAATTTFNGVAGGRIFGGVMASSIVIREVV